MVGPEADACDVLPTAAGARLETDQRDESGVRSSTWLSLGWLIVSNVTGGAEIASVCK